MCDDDLILSRDEVRWNLSRDIDFTAIEPEKLTPQWILDVREACLGELSALPATETFPGDVPTDIDLCSFVSAWFDEEREHYLVLREYLERVGVVVEEAELSRRRSSLDEGPVVETLTRRFCGEQRRKRWYTALSAGAPEPVLRRIFTILAADEAHHAAAYATYLRRAVHRNPAALPAVLRMTLWMMRTGTEVPTPAASIAGPAVVSRRADLHCIRRMLMTYRMLGSGADQAATAVRAAEPGAAGLGDPRHGSTTVPGAEPPALSLAAAGAP
jgi:hypothetical protein